MNNKLATLLIFVFCLTVGFFLRSYNLNWDQGLMFHPDERNIANAVTNIIFFKQLNPHFFAYGSLPIYILYLTSILLHGWSTNTISLPDAILLSRMYSALFSLLIIPLGFLIIRKLTKSFVIQCLTIMLFSFSTGFIQFAHFGTFEMWLSFFSLLLFYLLLLLQEKPTLFRLFLANSITGILLSIKISSLVLVPLPFLVYLFVKWRQKNKISLRVVFLGFFISALTNFVIYFFTNPFVFFDSSSFFSSIHYESAVALGSLPVFYTQSFLSTTPLLFQLLHVFPFLLNSILTVFFIPTLLLFSLLLFRQKRLSLWILFITSGIILLSQSLLFVKWTRYMVPVDGFFIIILGICFDALLRNAKKKTDKIILLILCLCICIASILSSTAYFYTVFLHTDTRIAAAQWANIHIPQKSTVLTDPYDLGITVFTFPHKQIVDIYDSEYNQAIQTELVNSLESADYIILPSQRIIRSRLLNPQQFPFGNKYYTALLQGTLGFALVYKTPCNIVCTLAYGGDPTFALEETTTVFDRPTIFIFKKVKQLPLSYYQKIL